MTPTRTLVSTFVPHLVGTPEEPIAETALRNMGVTLPLVTEPITDRPILPRLSQRHRAALDIALADAAIGYVRR